MPLIEIEDDSDDEDELIWTPEKGITPACLQYICEKYNITHYAYDITNQCFLKHVAKKYNYPALAYYAIGNHQYLIKDTKKIKTMVERAKCNRETNFITSVVEQKELINNFNIYDTLENIDITELTNYKSTDEKLNAINIIYSRVGYSDISDLFYKCIKHYNIVPSNIKSNKTKINYFELNLNGYSYLFSNDPNDLQKCNWKIIKELCNQHNIEFKNQSFVKFIKQLRDNFMLKKSERKTITEETRKNIISKHNNQCAICKNSKSDIKFEIDHIKPLASGGTNDITNLQPLCKACHKEKNKTRTRGW